MKWRAILLATCVAVAGFAARSRNTARPCSHRLVIVGLSQDVLRTGLVQTRIETEFAAVFGIVARRHEGPSGQHFGKGDDVVLGVAGPHAQRMQFQNLAGQFSFRPRVLLMPAIEFAPIETVWSR